VEYDQTRQAKTFTNVKTSFGKGSKGTKVE
jgi:hypothetical protein